MPYGISEETKELIRKKAAEEIKVRKPVSNDEWMRVMETIGLYGYSIGKHIANTKKI